MTLRIAAKELVAWLLCPALVGSCGSGSLAIFASGGGGGGGGNAPPVIGDVLVGSDASDAKTSPVTFTFRITDAESNAIDVDVLYVPPGGGPPVPVMLAGNTVLDDLASSPSGVVHARDWDFAAQIPTAGAFALGYALTVRTRNGSSSADSALFDVGNDAPSVSNVAGPSAESAGIVPISLTVSDSSSDLVSIAVEYDDLDDAAGWMPATSAGGPLTGITATSAGVALFFFWDAPADEPQEQFRARLRFTPDDGTATGTAVETADLAIDNNAEPVVLLNGSAFFATPDRRRGIPIPLRIVDPESDPVMVVLQWRTPFEAFPALPADPAALLPILADATLREQHQIATEAPVAFTGRVVPVGPTTVRLTELRSSQGGIVSGVLPGRTLEILRTTSEPAAAASSWSANPLSAPVGLLAFEDGDSALVLDEPSAGLWRLREIDLATGAVVRDVASSSGDPDAMTYEDRDASVLVASDVGGVWRVERVAISSGTVTTLITASGSTALGRIYGIVCRGPGEAIVTVGNSLIAIDATIPGSPTETTWISDLQAAAGLALDPHNRDRLYVAERDWVNPATSGIEGHVVAVDLVSLSREALAATGAPLLRPEAIAVDGRSGRLLALTDANTGDGTHELRAVDLNGGGGGQAFQIAAGFPNGCQGLATGPEGLRMLALTAGNDVAVAGGVEQARAIGAYDGATCEASVSAAFDPALDARKTWRIVDRLDPRPATGSGIDDVFVWNSADLVTAGEVVLRAVPYDGEVGLPTDSGVPRPVRAGLDVLPYTIGSAASTSTPASIESADLNGDGRLDLVTSNVGADNLSIFFQTAVGIYPTAPGATLSGVVILAPMTDPVSAQPIDVDGDGDLDVVSVNRGSNNVTIHTQDSPGSFSTSLTTLGGITSPSDVAGADLNGDGRIDLVVASTGSDRLAIYLHQTLGLYPSSPSQSIGNATTDAPAAVALGDLDGDGDVDIVSANQNANNLTIFHQSSPGSFPAAPSAVLGGAGLTDGLVSIAVRDLDRDGKLDIACANRTGNDLAVFLQDPAGGFNGTPTSRLASSESPLQPAHVEIADVNDDGALDLLSCNGGNDVSVFVYQAAVAQFASRPIVLGNGGSVSGPSSLTAEDFNGDGLLDLAVSNATGNDVAVFAQRGAGGYTSTTPDLVLGDALATSNPAGLAVGDLDGDGDLDLVTANRDSSTLSVFEQLSPAIFGADPALTLGSPAETSGARAVVAADLDGDGRLDLACANGSGGTLSIFFQDPVDVFDESADLAIGNSVLGTPVALAAADLDGDGRSDLVSANSSGDDLAIFFQAAGGGFGAAPSISLGNASSTDGPAHVLAVDLDGDGDDDLASANTAGNNVAVFLNPGGGAFAPAPTLTLGSAANTPSPRALAAGDLDGDGDLDLVCASGGNSSLAVFLQGAPGVFPAAPSFTRTHASLVTPDTVAVADVDLDGDQDLVSGNTGSTNLTLFRQGNPGVLATTPETVGGASWTNSPRTLALVDLDGDGDLDLVSAQPVLDNVAIFFGSH